MARRRRRKNRPAVSAEVLFWSLALINITAGCLLSPITSLTRLSLEGVHPDSEEGIRKEMEKLEGIPYALIHRGWVEGRLLVDGNAEGLQWKGNIFGRAAIELIQRKPVARIFAEALPDDLVIDEQGRVYRSVSHSAALPLLHPPTRLSESTGMLLSSWEAGTAGAFMNRLGRLKGLEVRVSEDSSFALKRGTDWLQIGALSTVEEALAMAEALLSGQEEPPAERGGEGKKDQSDSPDPKTDQTNNDSSNVPARSSGTNPSTPLPEKA